MKLKRLIAAAVAMALTFSISMPAFAATYDLKNGSITISADENGQTVKWGGVTSNRMMM